MDATNASFIMGFIVFVLLRWDTASQYGKEGKFPSHAWGIWPITMHWIAGQSEQASLLRTMSFVKIDAFQKGGHRGATIMYSMWKIMYFVNLKPHKYIALHQIHQIMLFLATSYDPFDEISGMYIQLLS